jgi:WD40 repeat protein
VRVLDAVTGTEIARESYPEYIVQLAFGDSGRHIMAASFDGTIAEFEPFTTTFVARLPYSAGFVEIGDSGRYVALASIGSNRVLEVENGREVLSFSRDDRYIGRVALSPDERFLASGNPSGLISLYDIAEKKLVPRIIDPRNGV